MRIGDVGSVSHAGDLLAFSLAIVLVLTLVYQVDIGTIGKDEDDSSEWATIIRNVREWHLMDPDDDGVIELDGIHERIRS